MNFIVLRHHLSSKFRVKKDFFHFFKMAAKAGMCLNLFLSKPYAQITMLISTKPSTIVSWVLSYVYLSFERFGR